MTRTICTLLCAALAGCGPVGPSRQSPPAQAPPAAPPAASRSPLQPFTETIPGTPRTFDMVPIEAGTVTLGERSIEVAPFWIARTETTWDLYDLFALSDAESEGADAVTRPSRTYVPPDRGFGHEGYPAISIAIKGAEHYCKWLSKKTGRTYRLPSEAEWRLACARAGIAAADLDQHAWTAGNADFTTHPVAAKKRDALGLHDLWGNVAEWCTPLEGPPVALGGSFREKAAEISCEARAVFDRKWQSTDPQVPKSVWWLSDAEFLGFRVVCVPPDGGR